MFLWLSINILSSFQLSYNGSLLVHNLLCENSTYFTHFTRLQRWDGGVQKYFLYCLGRWWPGQNPTAVETLLHKYTGDYFVLLQLHVVQVHPAKQFPSLSARREMKWLIKNLCLLYNYPAAQFMNVYVQTKSAHCMLCFVKQSITYSYFHCTAIIVIIIIVQIPVYLSVNQLQKLQNFIESYKEVSRRVTCV